jgi:hypothetical protein
MVRSRIVGARNSVNVQAIRLLALAAPLSRSGRLPRHWVVDGIVRTGATGVVGWTP